MKNSKLIYYLTVIATLFAVAGADSMARVKWPSEKTEKEGSYGGKWDKAEKLSSEEAEQNGVVYQRYRPGYATCRVANSSKGVLVQLNILPKIQIGGESCVVDRVSESGFAQCKKLVSVTIPATVRLVGKGAFQDCGKLKSVVIQNAKVDFELSKSKWLNGGPFLGCGKIEEVKWPGNKIPPAAFVAFVGNEKCPYARVLDMEAASMSGSYAANSGVNYHDVGELSSRPSFRTYADEKITGPYSKWITKKPYESSAQYAQRTTKAKCEEMKQRLYNDARSEYISAYAPHTISGTLSDYDDVYKVYSINVPGYGDIYAQVPLADRSFFEDNWTGVEIEPVYNIVDNELKIMSCTYKIGLKTYVSPETFEDAADDYSKLDFSARQIDFDDLALNDTPANQPAKSAAASAPAKGNRYGKKAAAAPAVNVDAAPNSGMYNPNTFALVVGNQDYKYVDQVDYAVDDAMAFARYCKNTLGLPSANIMAIQNVTRGELRRTVRELEGIFEDGGAEKSLIVYYAGHGIPDANNNDALILPVDASASDMESCYSLQELYNQLGALGASSVVVYMDACFTGASRGGKQLMASRAGVNFQRSQVEPRGNMVVVSATSANETAQPYAAAKHGIFTFHLLDKLRSTQGNVTLGELTDHVVTKVKSQSLTKGGKKQVPSVMVSGTFEGDWRKLPASLKIQ